MQRWLGHHSPAFTLSTYVHLLAGDIGEPLAISIEMANSQEGPNVDLPDETQLASVSMRVRSEVS